MRNLTLSCIYAGKPSTLTIIQGRIDLVFLVGKAKKYDSFSSLYVSGNKVSFEGLYHGSCLRRIEITTEQAKEITAFFKIRVSNLCNEAWYLDHSLSSFKVAVCGEEIYRTVLQKKATLAAKYFRKKYAVEAAY